MSEASQLILFCTILILGFRLIKPEPATKFSVLIPFSLYVLYRISGSILLPGLILLWASGVYALGFFISRGSKQTSLWIALYVLAVVGLFSVLKMQWFGSFGQNSLLDSALPVGFSFLMFYSIAFLHDVRVGKIEFPGPRSYFSSILFFPTLFAGPWQRHQDFIKPAPEDPHGSLFFQGYSLSCLGLFKFAISGFLLQAKLVPALPLSYDPRASSLHPFVVMAAASIYLFMNFSGFSDLVVGLSRMLGFEVRPNFRFPFLSPSVAEYWRRWHMSLGAWFSEYFYGPLAYLLSEKIAARWAAAFAAFVTFVIIGLWHQYSLKFLLYAVVNAAFAVFLFPRNRNKWWGIPLTFTVMCFLNTLFLSWDLASFMTIASSVFTFDGPWLLSANLRSLLILLFVSAFVYFGERNLESVSANREMSPNAYRLTFALSTIYLFYGITIGSGRVASVYVGY